MEVDSSRSTSITITARESMGPTLVMGSHQEMVGWGRPVCRVLRVLGCVRAEAFSSRLKERAAS
jgi:hypothetical protein